LKAKLQFAVDLQVHARTAFAIPSTCSKLSVWEVPRMAKTSSWAAMPWSALYGRHWRKVSV